MLASILQKAGLRVGSTTSGIYIDNELIVETAVLETTCGGILREGLGFDECDVGAVPNIAEASPDRALLVCDVRLHVLSVGDRFDLVARRPALDPEPARPFTNPRAGCVTRTVVAVNANARKRVACRLWRLVVYVVRPYSIRDAAGSERRAELARLPPGLR